MEEARRGNRGQVFGGNVQLNRGGGGGTHRGGGGVQIPPAAAGTVRQLLVSSPAQHQEGKAVVGEAWRFAMEGGVVARSLGKVLSHVSSGGVLVWSR